MKNSIRFILAIILQTLLCSVLQAQTQGPLTVESATVSRDYIVFSYAGDIWLVDRKGGSARRLTTHAARETYPVFSPDGTQVAFTRVNSAGGPFSWDVYSVAIADGEARRLTYHPDLDFPINWTPDGKDVLILSFRNRTSLLEGRLYTVPAHGGFPAEVPLPRGWAGSYSPNADRIAYTPFINTLDVFGWRNYRGGATSKIWLVKLSDASVESIPHENFNDLNPMWIGDKVYFVSDRQGTENLFVYDTARKSVAQLTRFEKYGIRQASASADSIVFIQGGAIHLFDPKTNQETKVEVQLSGDFPEVKPRQVSASQWLNWIGLAPDGSSLLLGMRGELITASVATGASENITQTGAAVERSPVWSPDKKWITYFSDESGEQEIVLRPAQGAVGKRRVPITNKPSFYGELSWSPDSKKLVFSDAHLALWCYDLATTSVRRLDTARYTDGDTSFQPAWSPDSRWLAYSKFGIHRLRQITLYSFDNDKAYTVTGPQMDAQGPLFDLNGKYLYFLGGTRTGLVESQGMSGFPFRTVTRSLYAVVLNQRDRSPMVQPSDSKEAAASPQRMVVDVEKISARVLLMPFWPSNGNRIMVGKPGTLFIVEGGTLHKFVVGKPGLEKFVEGAGTYRTTPDGARLLLRRQGNWAIVSTDAPPKPEDGRFSLNPLELTIDPRAEWKQMYGEAWRRMREHFYDPNLHGQNLVALRDHYAAYLPNIVTREDLNLLLKECFRISRSATWQLPAETWQFRKADSMKPSGSSALTWKSRTVVIESSGSFEGTILAG